MGEKIKLMSEVWKEWKSESNYNGFSPFSFYKEYVILALYKLIFTSISDKTSRKLLYNITYFK